MAITKVFAICARLDDRLAYIVNEEKTDLDRMINYAVNEDKTDKRLFQTAINCASPDTAYHEILATKRRWGKEGGVLGYHFIQSFAPGEVTPEEAHRIGMEFARRCFGDRFETVIGTHLDRAHLHNHIIVNSVSCVDGKKYHSSPESYYNNIRVESDRLCIENRLSVIDHPQGRGMAYAEYMANRQGKRTWRDTIRDDVNEAISCCRAPSQFAPVLRKLGYEVKENVKYLAIRPPGKERFIRLKSLGEQYEWPNIQRRIFNQKSVKILPEPRRKTQTRNYWLHGILPGKKFTGYRALYYHYLYKMGILPKHRASAGRVPFALREDLYKLERIIAETKFLCTHNIDTAEQLSAYRASLEAQLDTLATERKLLRSHACSCHDEAQTTSFQKQAKKLTGQLSVLRREIKLCEGIRVRSLEIPQKLKQAKQEEHQFDKEMMKHEHQRGRGGPSR